MNSRMTYRAELFACNLAIHTLNRARPIRKTLQKSIRIVQSHELPLWAAVMALSSLTGMVSGFALYIILLFLG